MDIGSITRVSIIRSISSVRREENKIVIYAMLHHFSLVYSKSLGFGYIRWNICQSCLIVGNSESLDLAYLLSSPSWCWKGSACSKRLSKHKVLIHLEGRLLIIKGLMSKLVLKPNCLRIKVQLFWEGHKNFRNLPHGFDVHKCQNHEEDCANFCGLLRNAELYQELEIMHCRLDSRIWDMEAEINNWSHLLVNN